MVATKKTLTDPFHFFTLCFLVLFLSVHVGVHSFIHTKENKQEMTMMMTIFDEQAVRLPNEQKRRDDDDRDEIPSN